MPPALCSGNGDSTVRARSGRHLGVERGPAQSGEGAAPASISSGGPSFEVPSRIRTPSILGIVEGSGDPPGELRESATTTGLLSLRSLLRSPQGDP